MAGTAKATVGWFGRLETGALGDETTMKCNLKNRPPTHNYGVNKWFEGFEKELRDLKESYSQESGEVSEAVAKANPIFKAGIEAGHRSVYWLQGYIQAIKEILGESTDA